MGLLDGILSSVAGSMLGGGQSPQEAGTGQLDALINSLGGSSQMRGGDLIGIVMTMVQQNGGLTGVLDMLRSNGLAQQADSWVGTGANVPVSGDQMNQVFGNSMLGNLASQLGTSESQVGSLLAQVLPELVNQLTPEGQVPDNHSELLAQGMALLRR